MESWWCRAGCGCALAYPPAIDLRPLADGDFGTTPTRALGAASTIRGGIPAGDPLCGGTDERGQTRGSRHLYLLTCRDRLRSRSAGAAGPHLR